MHVASCRKVVAQYSNTNRLDDKVTHAKRIIEPRTFHWPGFTLLILIML